MDKEEEILDSLVFFRDLLAEIRDQNLSVLNLRDREARMHIKLVECQLDQLKNQYEDLMD